MVDLRALRQRIQALPDAEATTPVSRRWLEQVERDLTTMTLQQKSAR